MWAITSNKINMEVSHKKKMIKTRHEICHP